MLASIARAAQALAAWRYFESRSGNTADLAKFKGYGAQAFQDFVQAAYAVAFDLVPRLIENGEEITTRNEVRYTAARGEGGFVIQKMNLDPANPGVFLVPSHLSTGPSIENWLQLMIDLPELLEILEVK